MRPATTDFVAGRRVKAVCKRQTTSPATMQFPAFYPPTFPQNFGIGGDSRGMRIASREFNRPSYQEIGAHHATTLRFGLLDHPLRDLWAEVRVKGSLRAHRVLFARRLISLG